MDQSYPFTTPKQSRLKTNSDPYARALRPLSVHSRIKSCHITREHVSSSPSPLNSSTKADIGNEHSPKAVWMNSFVSNPNKISRSFPARSPHFTIGPVFASNSSIRANRNASISNATERPIGLSYMSIEESEQLRAAARQSIRSPFQPTARSIHLRALAKTSAANTWSAPTQKSSLHCDTKAKSHSSTVVRKPSSPSNMNISLAPKSQLKYCRHQSLPKASCVAKPRSAVPRPKLAPKGILKPKSRVPPNSSETLIASLNKESLRRRIFRFDDKEAMISRRRIQFPWDWGTE